MADEDEKPRAVKESFDYADWQKVAEIKKQCPRCGPTLTSETGLEGTPPPPFVKIGNKCCCFALLLALLLALLQSQS